MREEELNRFKQEKGKSADSCKVLLHYARPDGVNIRHQYIYEASDGELRNFVFITNKENITVSYRNYLGEVFDSKDTPVSASMEPVGPEVKVGFGMLGKQG